MQAIVHRGCTDTVRESALKVDWDCERKYPSRNGDSNPRQYCAWLLSRTLYPLSYRRSFAYFVLIQQVLYNNNNRASLPGPWWVCLATRQTKQECRKTGTMNSPKLPRVYVSTPLACLGLCLVRWTKWFLWCVVLSVCCPLHLAVSHVGAIISLFGQFSSRSAVPL